MMENLNHLSVHNRKLYVDGSTEIDPSDLEEYLQYVDTGKLYVTDTTTEIDEYNKSFVYPIRKKTKLDKIVPTWNIPLDIESIDIEEHIDNCLAREIEENNFTSNEINLRIDRIFYELEQLKAVGIYPLLYEIIHIINTFEENDIIWGVGRGSSTSSYVLYLLGLHDVDSVEYELDFSEFLH